MLFRSSFDYKDWDSETADKVASIIRNTVPDGRLVSEILGGASTSSNSAPSQNYSAPSSTQEFFNEASSTNVGSSPTKVQPQSSPSSSSASSLDDLYKDL